MCIFSFFFLQSSILIGQGQCPGNTGKYCCDEYWMPYSVTNTNIGGQDVGCPFSWRWRRTMVSGSNEEVYVANSFPADDYGPTGPITPMINGGPIWDITMGFNTCEFVNIEDFNVQWGFHDLDSGDCTVFNLEMIFDVCTTVTFFGTTGCFINNREYEVIATFPALALKGCCVRS